MIKACFASLLVMLYVVECSMDLEGDKEDQILASVEMMGWFGHFLRVAEKLKVSMRCCILHV